MSGGIFVSYRRADSRHVAGRLGDRLVDHFGAERVFIDVETIEPGVDFGEAIARALAASGVLVAVIGPGWLSAVSRRGGRRLDDPDDLVRLEIGTALLRGLRVIPVLVEDAVMPAGDELPPDLAGLARRHALPVRHETFPGDARRLVVAVERALAGEIGARDRPGGLARAGRLFAEAERVAGLVLDPRGKVTALCEVAVAVAATDPGRAQRLDGQAERVARSITGQSQRESALGDVVRAAAATDPARAEVIANSLGGGYPRARALCDVAAADPGHAGWLYGEAEVVAKSIDSEMLRYMTLGAVAQAVAAVDPRQGERIVGSIGGAFWKSLALWNSARAMAPLDPDRAERLARSNDDLAQRARSLCYVAQAVAPAYPERADALVVEAARLADRVTDPLDISRVVSAMSSATAVLDPDQAERLAGRVNHPAERAWALCDVALAVATTDPGRAFRLFHEAERFAASVEDASARALAVRHVAVELAAVDPAQAERVADSITAPAWKAAALAAIAKTLAEPAGGRHRRLSRR